MLRRLPATILPLLLIAAACPAAEQQFPYQAVVVSDQVDVRCGPGAHFYVTNRISQNDVVTVHRHDHGGWYMIAPPPGSFSWIDASIVQRVGSNRGLVTIPPQSGQRAIVHIGSTLGDERSYYGRELSNGDEVAILDEKTLPGDGGPVRMLKIVPPQQEFRWIRGEFLVPMSQQVRQQLATDPYQVPPEHRQRLAAEGKLPTQVEPEAIRTSSRTPAPLLATDLPPASEHSTEANDRGRAFAELDRIDQELARLLARDPRDWNFDRIERDYRELRSRTSPTIALLIDQRLEVVGKRQDAARHYRDFLQISQETSRRDAQLLSQLGEPQTAGGPPGNTVPSQLGIAAGAESSVIAASAEFPEGSTLETSAAAGARQLSGAGILHQTAGAPGTPPFVLLAPDGRVLAYVQPGPGVSLENRLGKPTGLIGQRTFDAGLGSDLIRVERVIAVSLVP